MARNVKQFSVDIDCSDIHKNAWSCIKLYAEQSFMKGTFV